jgi:hypothetical protein
VLAAGLVAAAALTATLAWAWWPDPDAALRERLGGLASLLIGDDPLLRACADPGHPVPGAEEAEADPVATVTAQTEALRELALDQPPEVRLLADAEMTAQVAEFFEDRGEAEQIDLDTRALTALGAIPPGTDLAALRVEAFAEQVSGYHLGEQQLIGIRVSEPDRLSPLERVVLAHELEHALSFQHLGRPADHRDQEESADARRASSALVEGSAAATMLQYATAALTPAEQSTMRDQLRARAEQRALSRYSPYLLAELRFPYQEGLRYTCQRWLDGGWAAVRAAYLDPPATTAAILFPDRPGDPRKPAGLSDPGRSWEHARTSSFGAAELEWLLAAPGGNPAAGLDRVRERVSTWDGGELTVWTRGDASAVGLALVDRGGGARLCDTVRQWYAAAFPVAVEERDGARVRFDGRGQDAVLDCPGSQVRLGIAPTLAAAAAIAG